MSSPYLQLTLHRAPYSLTPLPGHVVSSCSHEDCSGQLATHRLLKQGSAARLLCDDHAVRWSREHGWYVTWDETRGQRGAAMRDRAAS